MNTTPTHISRLPYVAPTLESFEYAVEHGFAKSPAARNIETFSEINDNSEFGDDNLGNAGENYHGEWY